MHDAINVKACLAFDASPTNKCSHALLLRHNTMESPHPDERPHKKRRFFTEDSSPIQVRTKQPSPRPPTPPPAPDSNVPPQSGGNGQDDAGDMGGFDVAMLQAVVGELSMPTLQKLKDVSGNNVERGRHKECEMGGYALTLGSNQSIS